MTPADENGRERDGDDLVAAEYVLGVTPAQERQDVARRIASDTAFARLVDAWEMLLSPLARNYDEVPPPEALKRALDRRLFHAGQPDTGPSDSAASRLWQSLTVWRGIAAASLVALFVYVALPFAGPPAEGPAVGLVASLAAEDSDVRYLAVYDAARDRVGLSRMSGIPAAEHDFELWVIEGDNSPVSLGVIPPGETVQLTIPEAVSRMLGETAILAISLEPVGGSPTGQPTGPVVAAGDLRKI
ncbi:MAG TPA: anti-sigma factor [Aestuariivirgaceae bacterium]|nr:anti-sigma factor [Aestuariivirgaceae bacterium]